METQQKQPTLVARLMGLDALPVQRSVSVAGKVAPVSNIENVYTIGKAIREHHQPGSLNCSRIDPLNSRKVNSQVSEKRKSKDVPEVRKMYHRSCDTKNGSLSIGKCNDSPYEKRVSLVHKKFMEAKRLARNENLLQSREFQDALEVLSSNRDLFLRFLGEPNPWFSKNFQDMHPSQHSNNKCITVLKPSKMMADHTKDKSKLDDLRAEANAVKKERCKGEFSAQPTRIVVLKPNPGKKSSIKETNCAIKDTVPFPSSSGRFPESEPCGELGDHAMKCSKEAAKEITRKMQEKLGIYRRDEILLTSAQSKRNSDGGRISLNKSLSECMEEEWSDSFSQLKTTQDSGDQTDRCSSPCSFSSLSQASYSPESSVVKEAKRHLSERWVLMASNGKNLKHSRLHSSNTLGRMLADPEAKKEGNNEVPLIIHSGLSSGGHVERRNHAQVGDTSSTKTLPISTCAWDSDDKYSENQPGNTAFLKDANLQKIEKAMLKGKISSLFSSKSKTQTVYQSHSSPVRSPDKQQSREFNFCVKRSKHAPQFTEETTEGPQQNYEDILKKNLSTLEPDLPRYATPTLKEATAFQMERLAENSADKGEQPSPTSVLETTFGEEEMNITSSSPSEKMISECCRVSSQIPSIESVARSLSWDEDNFTGTCNMEYSEDDEEWVIFVQKLLAYSGLGNVTSTALLSRLYSFDSPLDPVLLDKFVEPKREGAKSRQRRSYQHLLFDCVNFLLLEIIQNELVCKMSIASTREQNEKMDRVTLTDKVLMQMKQLFLFADEGTFVCRERGSMVLDTIIRYQVRGKAWEETLRSEILVLAREIARRVLDDLVREVLDCFVFRCLLEDSSSPICLM